MDEKDPGTRIDGPNGTYWISKHGADAGRNRIYGYRDSQRQFYFSLAMEDDPSGTGVAFDIPHADTYCPYCNGQVVLGDAKGHVMANIIHFLRTRKSSRPSEYKTDSRDMNSPVVFSWHVR